MRKQRKHHQPPPSVTDPNATVQLSPAAGTTTLSPSSTFPNHLIDSPHPFNYPTTTAPFTWPGPPSHSTNYLPAGSSMLGVSQDPEPSSFSTSQPRMSRSPASLVGSQADPLALYYMRPQGKTGIFPGFEAWPLKMKGPGALDVTTHPTTARSASPSAGVTSMSPKDNNVSTSQAAQGSTSSDAPMSTDPGATPKGRELQPEQQDPSLLFEPGTNMPRSEILSHLVKLFFEHMAHAHFPFLSQQDLHSYIRREPPPEEVLPGSEAYLLNAICAISARFSDDPRLQSPHGKHQNGAPFWDRARDYVLPMLAIPSFNNAASLLLMAWHCFGQNAGPFYWLFAPQFLLEPKHTDSLLWNFSGMAMRMGEHQYHISRYNADQWDQPLTSASIKSLYLHTS